MVRPADYIHPEDEAARRNMEAIPGFAAAMKLFMRYYDEQIVHGMNMANKIRLSPTQLPEIYQKLPPICQRLSISEPEFYLEMDPYPNAYAMGDTRTMRTYRLPAHALPYPGFDFTQEYRTYGNTGKCSDAGVLGFAILEQAK